MGGLPLALLLFVPRTSLSFLVIGVAMACRAVARLLQTASGYKRKANLRILIVTDYMPPQTHGIAVRFRQYIDYMRKAGHEVQVFCTDIRRDTESSFDHPNLPSIVNPYNVKNRVAYSSGAHGHPGAPSPPSPPSLAPFSPLPSPSPSHNPAPLSPSVLSLSAQASSSPGTSESSNGTSSTSSARRTSAGPCCPSRRGGAYRSTSRTTLT